MGRDPLTEQGLLKLRVKGRRTKLTWELVVIEVKSVNCQLLSEEVIIKDNESANKVACKFIDFSFDPCENESKGDLITSEMTKESRAVYQTSNISVYNENEEIIDDIIPNWN